MKGRFLFTRKDLFMILLAIAYVVIPFDFIPELVAGPIGLTDDLAASVLVGTRLWGAHQRLKEAPSEPAR